MNIPTELKYSKNDEWLKVEGNQGTVGITDYAQEQLSDVVYVELVIAEGDQVKAGDVIATVESVKAAADVYAPVSGTVTAVNDDLADTPEIINSDPYGDAWLLRLTLSDPAEADALMDAEAYAAYCEEREH